MKHPNDSIKKNVLGEPLKSCSCSIKTGYFRDGYCRTNEHDYGSHTVCAEMTEEFLTFSILCGNDLSTPKPQWDFPGLKPGDYWCICASRWQQAWEAGVAPPVVLEACEQSALKIISLEALKARQVKPMH